ncbi:MAG: FAD:protein FMN transferase [Verrucomicrobiota bacterium]
MSSAGSRDLPPLHTFDVEGMNTVFTIRIRHADVVEARRWAGNCFRQLEELEAQLSRYRPDSDVSRINLLRTGESMLLTDAVYRCLQRSLEATELTAGLFDVTLGVQTRDRTSSESDPPRGTLTLSPDRPEILCGEAGREIDLGGIGKGFALDEMASTLRELGVERALLSCGASTHLAVGEGSWKVVLRGDREKTEVELAGEALSASGLGEQAAHVVHPDTGSAPDYRFCRVWVVAAAAALADALSTACLIMDEDELTGFASMVAEAGITIYRESAGDGTVRGARG